MKESNGTVLTSINNGEIELRNLTADKLEDSLKVLDSFFLNESVCKACEIDLPQNEQARNELRELSRVTAEDGVSLIAVNKATEEVVGVAFNKIQCITKSDDEEPFFLTFRNKSVHSPQAKALIDFMLEVDSERDVFTLYSIDCVCELMFLVTSTAWEKKGIGRALVRSTVDFIKQLYNGKGIADIHVSLQEMRPKAVTALWTSKFSQSIGKNNAFQVINTVPYTRFKFNGKTFDQRISPIHKSCEQSIILFQ